MKRIIVACVILPISLFSYSQELVELQLFRGSNTPNGSGNLDQFGAAVDFNGSFAVIGAPKANGSGAAYVFEKQNEEWVEVAILTPSDAASGDDFGQSVSIEGDVVVIGAPSKSVVNSEGAVYIYEEPVTGWVNATETIKISSPNPNSFGSFGEVVQLSGDELLIAAPYEQTNFEGRIYVYTKSGASWSTAFVQAELTTLVSPGDILGISATLFDDIIVSGAGTGSNTAGSAHIFEKPGAAWMNSTDDTRTVLQQNRGSGDNFGGEIAVSSKYIISLSLQGTSQTNSAALNAGGSSNKIHVFIKPGNKWSDGPDNKEDDYSFDLPSDANLPGFLSQNEFTEIKIIGDLVLIGSSQAGDSNNIFPGSIFIYRIGDNASDLVLIDRIDGNAGADFGRDIANEVGEILISSPEETRGGVVRYYRLQYNEAFTQTLCPGTTFDFGAQTISEPGIYNETFTSVEGIDSLVQLTLVRPLRPSITEASTVYGTRTSEGLVVTPDPSDNISTHFVLSGISGGKLYLNDQATEVNDGDYISLTEGSSGLIFEPSNAVNGALEARGSVSNDGSCLSANSQSAQVAVSKAQLTATASNVTIGQGDPIPSIDIVYSGFVNGDDIPDIDEVPVAETGITSSSVAGDYTIVLTGGSDDNYEFELIDGVLTIEESIQVLGLEDKFVKKVYPNPIGATLNISGAYDISNLAVFTLSGKEMLSVSIESKRDNISLDVSQLEAGIYVLKFAETESGRIQSQRIIIR